MKDTARLKNKLRLIGAEKDKLLLGPSFLSISITDLCNLACGYCGVRLGIDPQKKAKEMDLGIFKGIICDCARMGVENITLSGGEPFLHSQISSMIHFIKEKNMKVSFNTNGTPVKPLRKDLGLITHLTINMSSMNHEDYRKNQGGDKETFDNLVGNLKYISDHRKDNQHPSVELVYILTKDNFLQMLEMIRWAQKRRADSIRFKFATIRKQTSGLALTSQYLKKLKEIARLILAQESVLKIKTNIRDICKFLFQSDFYNKCDDIDASGHRKSYYFHRNFKKHFSCYYGWFYAKIETTGDVFLCCSREDITKIGNIYNSTFKKIWNSRKAHKLRLDMKYNFRIQDQRWKECVYCHNLTDLNSLNDYFNQ